MQKKKKLNFPKHFLWGAAVSAHQVEGGNHNQWSVWEQENANALAAQAEYHYDSLHNWPDIKQRAKDPDNYISGQAANHYELYEQDFDLIKKLNMNAFRFSIEWSRVEPREGVWDAEAIAYYKNYIKELKARDIEPVVTLFHFTLPVWFSEKGGFERRKNVDYFVRYVEKIMTELGSQVKYVMTINEPMIYAEQSYFEAAWPPQVHSKRAFLQVLNNLIVAHNRAARVIKSINQRAQVSIAYNTVFYYGGDDAWLTRTSAVIMQYLADDYYLSRVYKNCDFLGVNYYCSNRVFGYRVHNPEKIISDIGWEVEPENIEFTVTRLYRRYKLPIFITENGIADAGDEARRAWLVKTVTALQKSIDDGVEVIGYLHWSLLDNFEWAHGKWPKFGLIEVDYKTYTRKLRPSAVWLSKIIKHIQEQ